MKKIIAFVVFLAVFCVGLCYKYTNMTMYNIKYTLIAAASGVAICIAGAIFQTVFRNPIASPNIIGVSTGVSIGNIVFVMTYQAAALTYYGRRYIYCYLFSIGIVLLTVAVGRFTSPNKGTFRTEGLILVAMIITHLGQVFTQYFQYIMAGDENGLLEIYTSLTNGDYLFTDNRSITILLSVILISVLPIFLLRYRFNAVSFNDEEMLASGVSNKRVRTIGLVCSGLMATAALIHCGDVGFLSMAVPFICRNQKTVKFGEVVFLSGCVGGTLSIFSRIMLDIVEKSGILVPAGTVTTLIVLPLFAYKIMKQESGFVETGA